MESAKYVGLQTCQKNVQLPVALKTDAVGSFEAALRMNKTIRRNTEEGSTSSS
jgi:hypothetical protein